MVAPPGRYHLGPDTGRIMLRTFRDGLASQAGHDLTIEVTIWNGELTMGQEGVPTALEVRIQMDSLAVREGVRGIKPLTDRDRREIAHTAQRLLTTERNPEAVYTADRFEAKDGGGVIEGTFTLAGTAQPLGLEVTQTGPDRYRGTTTVVQSAYGIRPYKAFLGALKVRDGVDVEVEMDMSAPEKSEG
jgi:polyisoprenoid-binding protein YceI